MNNIADESISARELLASVRRDNPRIAQAQAELGSKLTVARNLLRLRVGAGLSQAELAQRIGMSQPRIAQIEAARVNVTITILDRLAAAFSVQTAMLFKPPTNTAPGASPAPAPDVE